MPMPKAKVCALVLHLPKSLLMHQEPASPTVTPLPQHDLLDLTSFDNHAPLPDLVAPPVIDLTLSPELNGVDSRPPSSINGRLVALFHFHFYIFSMQDLISGTFPHGRSL